MGTTPWWRSWSHETTVWWKLVALADALMHRLTRTGPLRSPCRRLCDYYDKHLFGDEPWYDEWKFGV